MIIIFICHVICSIRTGKTTIALAHTLLHDNTAVSEALVPVLSLSLCIKVQPKHFSIAVPFIPSCSPLACSQVSTLRPSGLRPAEDRGATV